MNWFRQNRFVGALLVALGVGTLAAVWFLFSAKSDSDDASIRLNQTVAELNRLEGLNPYPSEENLRKMKGHAEDYATALAKLKDELKMRVLPVTPMAPNEFQARLRVAMTTVAEKGRANKVKFPDKFYLGFDEFASALPRTEAAPLLGQELAQIEWLLNVLIDARVDALTSLRRTALPEESGAVVASPNATPAAMKPGATPPAGAKLFERNVVDVTFFSTPAAARRALNQIAGASQHFFIVRRLHVRNEKDKGPAREVAPDAAGTTPVNPASAAAGSPGAKPTPAALNFIVGTEHIETSAQIEIVRFTF
jgi:hypothetical protein